jgi:predicted ABC-type ATPase
MSGPRTKRLRMIAGPNGSGKSSIVRNLAKERSPQGVFFLNYFLNADDVERALVSTGLDLSRFDVETTLEHLCRSLRDGGRIAGEHRFFRDGRLDGSVLYALKGNGYLAAAIVDFLREELMRRGDSFSFETVMSHRSKIEFFKRARASGYKTYLYFVCTNSAELNIARVRSRVGMGGHSVPEDKIRERYVRCLELAREAVAHSYRAYFFDNSGPEPIWLAEFDPNGNGFLKPKPDQDRIPEPDELPRWFRDWVWDDWNPINRVNTDDGSN